MFLYQIASKIARRKKNFAPSALNGTKGWMLGNVWLYISFQNRQQEPRLAVRGKRDGSHRLYLDQWLALSTASWATLLLRHVIRCHSLQAGKSVKGRRRQMALSLFPRLSQVEESQTLETRQKLVATQPPMWWAWPFQVYLINKAQVWKYLEYQKSFYHLIFL